jgi:hypothetical protein
VAAEGPCRGFERTALAALVAASAVLHLLYVFAFRFDSDETQHLHVSWGWAHGLVQYRDVFDNHAPLFHMLSAAPLAALREGPGVLYATRLAMLPIALALLVLVFALGRSLFSPRIGVWSAVIAGLLPPLFLRTVEYRPDNLWAALWLLALALAVAGRVGRARSFAVGAILGVALVVSVKTLVLLGALAAGVGFCIVLRPELHRTTRLRALAGCALAFAGGVALAPACLLAFYGAIGSLDALRDCLLTHNSLVGLGLWQLPAGRVLELGALAGSSCGVAALLLWRAGDPGLGTRRAVVFLSAAGAQAVLAVLWPMWEPEHGLPYYPLLALFAVAGGAAGISALARGLRATPARGGLARAAVAAAFATFEVGALTVRLWAPVNRSDPTPAVIAEVVALTDRDDLVLDLKGETVFRDRPIYLVLEEVTRRKLKRGLLADAIRARVTATRTCVAVRDNPYFPPDGRAFLNAAFVPVGLLRVCGGWLAPDPPLGRFDVLVPNRYALVGERGAVAGWLDGVPYDGPRFLAAGPHRFRVRDAEPERVAFVWAQALERGFSPFAPGAQGG